MNKKKKFWIYDCDHHNNYNNLHLDSWFNSKSIINNNYSTNTTNITNIDDQSVIRIIIYDKNSFYCIKILNICMFT